MGKNVIQILGFQTGCAPARRGWDRAHASPLKTQQSASSPVILFVYLFVLLFLFFCFQRANPVGNFFIFYRHPPSIETLSSLSAFCLAPTLESDHKPVSYSSCFAFVLCSTVFEEPEDPSNRSFFSEIISSISDVKFSHSGRYIMTRDYLTVKVWDLNMENRPIETYQVQAIPLVGFYISLCLQMLMVQRDRGCS